MNDMTLQNYARDGPMTLGDFMHQVTTLNRSELCMLMARFLFLSRETLEFIPYNNVLSDEFPNGFILPQELLDELNRLNDVSRRNEKKLWKRRDLGRRGSPAWPTWEQMTDRERELSNITDITDSLIYWHNYGSHCLRYSSASEV